MANDSRSIFEVPTVAIITGASRGIGRGIAKEFAKRFQERLLLVITGRSEQRLEETASMIRSDEGFSSSKTTIRTVVGDLGNQNVFGNFLEALFDSIDPSKFDHAILVNNAASTGDVTKFVRDWGSTDVATINDYLFVNVTTTLILISKFLSVFTDRRKSETADEKPRRKTIVHLTSLSAFLPTESMSLYCAGKAAREMLHNVAALEAPEVRVLNYAPGPVDTAMLNHLTEMTSSAKTRELMKDSKKISVSPEKTASVLCDYLKDDQYKSGSRVDLLDIIGFPTIK